MIISVFSKISLAAVASSVTFCPSKDCSGGNNSPSRHLVAAGCIRFQIDFFPFDSVGFGRWMGQ
jgi:hypothetical protein